MRKDFTIRLATIILGIAIIFGCGGGGGGGVPGGGGGGGSNNGVNLTPNNASLAFGQTLNITGTVPGQSNQVIQWSTTGGTITPTGASSATFTAPAIAGTYVVTGRAEANQQLYGTTVINVSQVGITIDPISTTLNPGGTAMFTAVVTGAANQNVNFTATGGTITKSVNVGTYTAGQVTGSYTVTATSVADPSKSATATVIIANLGQNATVNGRVVLENTTIGIQGVIVAFYNSTGSELARATTGVDGRFSRLVPVAARRFHLIATSIPNGYYKQFSYAGTRYSPLVANCTVALPPLTAGQTYSMPVSVMLASTGSPPPPPPNGCQ